MGGQVIENEADVPEDKKKGKGRLIALAVIPIVAAASFFLVTKVINPLFVVPGHNPQVGQQDLEAEEVEGIMCELGTVLANPAGGNSRRIMKVGISVEVTSKELVEKVELATTKLKDQVLLALTSMQLDVLVTAEGKNELREHLKETFATELKTEPDEIRQVYFSEFVIQ